MKHSYLLIRSLLVFLLSCVWAISSFAQVNISVQVIPPFLYRITDYASHPEQIMVTLTNTTTTEQRLQLRGSLTGDNGVNMRVKDSYKARTPFVLGPGEVKILNASDFELFFNLSNVLYTGITEGEVIRGNGLPEDYYRLCVRAYNYDTNAPQSADSPSGCSNSFTVTNLEPPVILAPRDKDELVTNGTQLVSLSWATPPGAPPTTLYRVRIVEILGNGNPNDALMTTTQPLFENEVRGNMYIYSPADPQLVLGRRYAMMVTAFDPLNEMNFRNKGRSQVISFTYGKVGGVANTDLFGSTIPIPVSVTTPVVVPKTIPTTSKITGTVAFAFLEEEEKSETSSLPLAGTTPAAESMTYHTASSKAGANTWVYAYAPITVYGTNIDGVPSVLGTASSNANGIFSLSVNTAATLKCRDVYMVVTHQHNHLYPVTKYFKLERNAADNFDIDLGTTVLPIISMRVKPFVVSKTAFPNGKITVRIMLDGKKMDPWAAVMRKVSVTGSNETRLIGRTSYIVVAKVTSGAPAKQIFRLSPADRYMVEVSCDDKPPAYYTLETLPDRDLSDTTKSIGTIAQNFVYNPIVNEVEGIITFDKDPLSESRITATVKATDILDNATATSYEAVTDSKGYYKFTDLPALKRGAVINLSVTERRVRENPWLADVTITGVGVSLLKKDFVLRQGVTTIVGRVMEKVGATGSTVINSSILVTIKGTNYSTRTTADGYFIFKVPSPFKGEIIASADGYIEQKVLHYYATQNPKDTDVFTIADWANNIGKLQYQDMGLTNSYQYGPKLGLGDGLLENIGKTYFKSTEEIKQIFGAVLTKLQKNPTGDFSLQFFLQGAVQRDANRVGGTMTLTNAAGVNVPVPPVETGKSWGYAGPAGKYSFQIDPIKGGATFFPTKGEFTITDGAYGYRDAIVVVAPATMISGVVRDNVTGLPVAGAVITGVGTNYETITNSKGEYQLMLPNNSEYKIAVTKNSYDGTSEVRVVKEAQTLDFPIRYLDPGFPVYATLSGFPIKISKIEKSSTGFKIDGTLTLASNDLYTLEAGSEKLTFTNLQVKNAPPTETNAIPLADVSFEQAVLRVKAFGFAQVEVQGQPLIQLKARVAGNYASGIIGGNQLVVKLASTNPNEKLQVQLPDAAMKDDGSLNNAFNYVFGPPSVSIPELTTSRNFKLLFAANSSYTGVASFAGIATKSYLELSSGVGSFFVDRSTASVNTTGYNIAGYFQLPQIAGLITPTDKQKISIANLAMKPGAPIAVFNLGITNENPFIATMQKFQLSLTKMELSGVGSANPNLTMAGKISILKKENGAVDENGVLTIKSLSLITKTEGTTLSAVVKLPKTGLTMRSLNFTTLATSDELSMSYNFTEGSFTFETSGTLRYASTSTGTFSSALSSVFPMAIDKFRLRSKDWDVYLVARPNIEVDLKVVKIKVSRILVNIGYGMSMEAMANDLVNTVAKPVATTAAVNTMEQMDESRSSWAIGLTGAINFPVGGLTAGGAASFVIGNAGSGVDVVLREFDLTVVNPSFTLTTKVAIQFNAEKQGFEAAAKLTTLSKEFSGTFKYYSLANGGFQLAASIVTNAGVATGPLMWHTIGGGFDFDTGAQKYSVFFTGDVGPLGVPKKVAYVKGAKIEVLFDMNNCGGSPVIKGSGALFMKDALWGTMDMTADFCKGLLLVAVKTPRGTSVLDGVTAEANGVLYCLVPTSSSATGSFFLGFNAAVTVGNMVRGNGIFAFAYNYNNNNPGVSADIKTMFGLVNKNAVDADGTMNAVYMKGTLNLPRLSEAFDVNIAGFKAFDFRYRFDNFGEIELYYKYKEEKFMARTAISTSTYFRVSLLGVQLGALQESSLNLIGGFDGNWYSRGNARYNMQFFSDDRAGCNSFNITYCTPPSICPCFSYFYGFPYPNGSFNCSCGSNWVPCGIGFKLCMSASVDYDISSNGTSVNVRVL